MKPNIQIRCIELMPQRLENTREGIYLYNKKEETKYVKVPKKNIETRRAIPKMLIKEYIPN